MTSSLMRWICLASMCLIPLAGNAVTPMIAAGADNSLFLNGDGSVWGTGNIPGSARGTTSPVRLLQLSGVVSLAAGTATEFALLADGTIWGVGKNDVGQLGDNSAQYRSQPQQIPGISGVQAIATYTDSVLALARDGTVWAWGRNDRGQLGDGTQKDRAVPARVIGLTNIIAIAAGDSSALALRDDGTVWIWGWTAGAAGDGLNAGPNDPGYNHLVPVQVHVLDQVVAISAGQTHYLALRKDGTLWTWGAGFNGENGIGAAGLVEFVRLPMQIPALDHVVAISARGFRFSLALKSDGTVWAWGINNVGQLGASGITYSASPSQVPGLSDITAIAVGMQHILALRRDGTVLAWGANEGGQLGDSSLQYRSQPLPVAGPGGTGQLNLLQPAPSSINQLPTAQINQSVSSGAAPLSVQFTATNATDTDGTIKSFNWKTSDGQQASGQSASFRFVQPGTFTVDLLVVDNAGASGWAQARVTVSPPPAVAVPAHPKVGVGLEGAVALTNDGRVLTWGDRQWLGFYNTNTQLALPSAISLPMLNGITGAVDLTVQGGDVKFVLLADGTVLGWGQNSHGELGIGSQALNTFQPQLLSSLPSVQALAAGFSHELALSRDGRVFAWGVNSFGQLGVGDDVDRFQPTEVPGLTGVAALVGGYRFSAALKADGTVWAWGENAFHQLGDGTTTPRNSPIQVPGLTGITKIFATADSLFAQQADGTVWATGSLAFSPSTKVTEPISGARRVADLNNALQIAGFNQSILVLKPDGTIWTGGNSASYVLGLQSAGNFIGLKQLPGISDAIAIAASPNSAMALRRDGTVLAWGLNYYGQIGDGTLAFQQTPVLVVNEAGNGFLDLIPEGTNTIPRDKIPPFFLAAYLNGGLGSTTLYADLKGITPGGAFASSEAGRFAAGYNVYVAANVPGIAAAPYFQLNANNSWSALNWPMTEFLRAVALDSQNALVRAQILQNTDLSVPALAGASILVGYGIDADEMLQSARYRTVFTVPQP